MCACVTSTLGLCSSFAILRMLHETSRTWTDIAWCRIQIRILANDEMPNQLLSLRLNELTRLDSGKTASYWVIPPFIRRDLISLLTLRLVIPFAMFSTFARHWSIASDNPVLEVTVGAL